MKIFIFVILFSGTLFADMSMHEKLSDLPDDRPRIRRSTRADRGALAMSWLEVRPSRFRGEPIDPILSDGRMQALCAVGQTIPASTPVKDRGNEGTPRVD